MNVRKPSCYVYLIKTFLKSNISVFKYTCNVKALGGRKLSGGSRKENLRYARRQTRQSLSPLYGVGAVAESHAAVRREWQ